MPLEQETLEFRGTKSYHYANYFLSIGGRQTSEGVFTGPDWEVRLAPGENAQVFKIDIPVVRITFISQAERLKELIAAFQLHFLTLGG